MTESPTHRDRPAPDRPAAAPPPLTAERLAALAARLANGYYDRDPIRRELVRRLLAREFAG